MAWKEQFVADVVNSIASSASNHSRLHRLKLSLPALQVNDLVIEGFNSMEEFAAQALDLQREEARKALKQGVDGIYCQVQDNIDEHLSRWESICSHQFFSFSPPVESIDDSKNKDITNSVREDALQEEAALDSEMNSLRSQLIAAEREATKMRIELASLEKHLALRREVLGDVKFMEENFDGALVEDVIKSARLLQETIEKASSFQGVGLRRNRGATLKEKVTELRLDDLGEGHTEVIRLFDQ